MLYTLIIKNINKYLTAEKLCEMFESKKGKIKDVKLGEKYGFIEYDKEEALNEWLKIKEYRCEDGTILELGKGEKNSTLYMKIMDSKINISEIVKIWEKVPVLSCDVEGLEMIIKFENRYIAEDVKKLVEREYDNKEVKVTWADKDNINIGIHLSFNGSHANSLGDKFNKEILEKKFLEEKKTVNFSIDLPREYGKYKGYGTVVYEATFEGIKKCEGILNRLGKSFLAEGGILINISEHRRSSSSGHVSSKFNNKKKNEFNKLNNSKIKTNVIDKILLSVNASVFVPRWERTTENVNGLSPYSSLTNNCNVNDLNINSENNSVDSNNGYDTLHLGLKDQRCIPSFIPRNKNNTEKSSSLSPNYKSWVMVDKVNEVDEVKKIDKIDEVNAIDEMNEIDLVIPEEIMSKMEQDIKEWGKREEKSNEENKNEEPLFFPFFSPLFGFSPLFL
jgi:hypothetical protein